MIPDHIKKLSDKSESPYTILGIENGLQATAKEIGKAYNKLKRKARQISDDKERIARMEALEHAKEQLLRPESRVQIDFFLISDDLFLDLIQSLGDELGQVDDATQTRLDQMATVDRYEGLLPARLDRLQQDFTLEQDVNWTDQPYREASPLQIAVID